ncbi:hypothetical protein XELAEV_18028685mg [Xenopus laevis]|uniref:Uncharacterized protein n=1 Tax=Xenopus laevis TaxID=8355 RepID=A0A974CQW3_XENLA|nr:hypothetical protein XELAEV_18028685mg [Xenopus laevis]
MHVIWILVNFGVGQVGKYNLPVHCACQFMPQLLSLLAVPIIFTLCLTNQNNRMTSILHVTPHLLSWVSWAESIFGQYKKEFSLLCRVPLYYF